MSDKGFRKDTFDVTSTDKKPSSSGNEKIRVELEKLLKKGNITPADIIELSNRYKDEDVNIVEEVLRLRSKRYHKVRKQAKELAEKIVRKYNDGSRPLHEILDKMMKYKIDNKWTDEEYDEFRKELSSLLTGNRAMEIQYNQNLMAYRSRISRALGLRTTMEEGLRIKDSEQPILSEILTMHQNSAGLHNTVFMHSLMYEDCSIVAITGEYKRERHIASNYIHPLIACMYLPKFDIFEIHTLYANFGSIVKCRSEKKPIMTEPDSLLFYDITSDPNDVVCEVTSPITDLRNRYRVQINLWETVIKLRNGNYYEASPISEFLTTLNACRNNLYDNTDLAYNKDEGAILRRFLSVFSLRPTIISTKPIYTIASIAAGPFTMGIQGSGLPMGMGQSMLPFNNQPVYTITSIPMITMQIPPYKSDNDEAKDLRDAFNQNIWINENKTIIPKQQEIIYSREVLIFYVNRRVQRIQIRTFSNPLTFSQLPLTMSSFERLNAYPIYAPEIISQDRSKERFELRSVVAVTETEIVQSGKSTSIITGCTGLIMQHRNIIKNIFESKYMLYDPLGASLPVKHPNFEQVDNQVGYITNKPISWLTPVFSETINGVKNQSFHDRSCQAGTIYIYAKPSGYSNNEIISI